MNTYYLIGAYEQEFIDTELIVNLIRRRKEQIRTRNDINNQSLPLPEQSSWKFLYHSGDEQIAKRSGLSSVCPLWYWPL